MAFELPILPFPKDINQTPYIASPDTAGKYTVAAGQWFKNASGLWVPVSAADPLPATAEDGKIVSMGAKADAAVIDPALSASEISLLKGIIKQLQGDGTAGKAAPVQVTGRVVKREATPPINAVALTTTNPTYSAVIDVSDAKEVQLLVFNSHDVAVNVVVQSLVGGLYKQLATISVGVGITLPINKSSTGYGCLGAPLDSIKIAVIAASAPASGAITVELLKIPN